MKAGWRLLLSGVLLWGGILAVGAGTVALAAPENRPGVADTVTRSLGILLALAAFVVAKRSRSVGAKAVSAVYGVFFSLQALFGLINTGVIEAIVPARQVFLVVQYGIMLYFGLLTVLCTFLFTEVVAKGSGMRGRLGIAVAAGAVVVTLFGYPFLRNPVYVYTVPEITDFRIVDRARAALLQQGVADPKAEDLADIVSLSDWSGESRAGELAGERKLARIAELLPYTRGNDYVALLNRPIHMFMTSVALACILILSVFLAVKYVRDPPVGAHLEKIHFTLFLYCILEYFHAVAILHATSYEEVMFLDEIGTYVTALVMAVFGYFFLARARFLAEPPGNYYEERLGWNATTVTRWRDGIDEVIVRRFLPGARGMRRRLATRWKQPGG